MTTVEELEKLSLEDFAKLLKRNYKSLLRDKDKMKMMMKMYAGKLNLNKKPVKKEISDAYELFMQKGGDKDGNIKSR